MQRNDLIAPDAAPFYQQNSCLATDCKFVASRNNDEVLKSPLHSLRQIKLRKILTGELYGGAVHQLDQNGVNWRKIAITLRMTGAGILSLTAVSVN
jgi:hypothetical protein